MQSPSNSTYIPGLDGIRALAFLMVFWAHALPQISFYIPATLGVTIFFFLSGYLITTLLRRELEATGTIALRSFYLRRAIRIFIPLYVVYALTAAFAHFAQHESMGNWRGFFSLLFYYYNYTVALDLKAWVPLGMNVIWSLCVEEHFYLLFPLVYLALARSRLPRARQTHLLVAFCLLELLWRFVLIAILHNQHLWTYYATDARLDSILWGSILALTNNPVFTKSPAEVQRKSPSSRPEADGSIVGRSGETPALRGANRANERYASTTTQDRSILPTRHATSAFLAALLVLAASLIPRSILYKESLRYTVQALALYAIFSYIIPNTHRRSLAWLEWQPLRYLGWISYVLYLSHDFVLNVLTRHWPNRFAFTGILAFILCIAFATLLRYTLELPLQRLRTRLQPTP